MKITKSALKQLIKEELANLEEQEYNTTAAQPRSQRDINYGRRKRIGGEQTAGFGEASMAREMDAIVQIANEIAERVNQVATMGQAEMGTATVGAGFDVRDLEPVPALAAKLAAMVPGVIESHRI